MKINVQILANSLVVDSFVLCYDHVKLTELNLGVIVVRLIHQKRLPQ